MPKKDPPFIQPGGAPHGDFFDTGSVVPPVEALPDPPVVEVQPSAERDPSAQPVMSVSAPDTEPGEQIGETKTPEEWASELGHTDAPLASDGASRSVRQARGWVFAAAKAHAGWGRQHPGDVQISRGEYEAVVDEALKTPIGSAPAPTSTKTGEPVSPAQVRVVGWRHDVAAEQKTKPGAGGGDSR